MNFELYSLCSTVIGCRMIKFICTKKLTDQVVNDISESPSCGYGEERYGQKEQVQAQHTCQVGQPRSTAAVPRRVWVHFSMATRQHF